MAGHVDSLFGLQGWFDEQAYLDASSLAGGRPAAGWSILFMAGDNSFMLNALFWGSVGVLVLFTLGVAPRVTAVLTYVVIVSFKANPAVRLDADELLALLAFYVMLGYVFLHQHSGPANWWHRILGPRDAFLLAGWLGWKSESKSTPSYAAHLALRGLQVHFALIMVASGLHKLQIGDWWSGVAYWYPLHQPFETTHTMIRAKLGSLQLFLFVSSVATYAVLAWQLSFPFWAWRRAFRWLLLGGAAAGWLGHIFIYGMPYFGPFFAIAALSFLSPEEWRWLHDKIFGERSAPARSQVRKESSFALSTSGK
jgi:hypothetical protein